VRKKKRRKKWSWTWYSTVWSQRLGVAEAAKGGEWCLSEKRNHAGGGVKKESGIGTC